MRSKTLLALFTVAAVGCSDKSSQSMDVHAQLDAEGGTTRGEFSCKKSSSGGCEFTVFVEKCPESQPASPCSREAVETFLLKEGESRVFNQLPLNAKYCVKRKGSADEPVCPPVPRPPPLKKSSPQTAILSKGGASVA